MLKMLPAIIRRISSVCSAIKWILMSRTRVCCAVFWMMLVLTSLIGCDRKGDNTMGKPIESAGSVASNRKSAKLEPVKVAPTSAIVLGDAHPAEIDPALGKYALLASSDPARALAAISAEIHPRRQDEIRAALLVLVGSRSLEAIPSLSSAITDESVRLGALRQLGATWAGQPRQLFDFASKNLTGLEGNTLMGSAVQCAASRKGFVDAAAMLEAMPVCHQKREALSALASQFGRESLEEALKWAKSLSYSEEQRSALHLLAPHIARERGLRGIMETLPLIENESTRIRYFQQAARLLAAKPDEDAMEWLTTLPQKDRGRAVETLIREMPFDRIQQLSEYAFELPDKNYRTIAVMAVTEKTAKADFDATAAWVLALPHDVKEPALTTLLDVGYANDANKLSDWARTLPNGADRDFAFETIAKKLAPLDKDRALEWASAIQDAKIRSRVDRAIRER
jgi:hypothetical protein